MTRAVSPGRQIARIAVPVSLEYVILLVLNFATQVIVGTLGAVAIAAVGFANSLVFVFVVTLSSVSLSVSILVARALGAGKRHEMGAVVSTATLLSAGLTSIAAIALAVEPEPALRLLGASPAVAAEAAGYLRLTAIGMVPLVVSSVFSGVLRSTGRPRIPLYATAGTVVANTALAYALVFGVGPFPAMGVTGAGVATLIANLAKVAILAPVTLGRAVPWELPTRAELRGVITPVLVLAIPLAITEFVWTVGTFLYNVVFQRLGDDPLAAAQIVNALEGAFIVGSLGLMTASSVLISQELGRGDAPAAIAWIRRISRAGLLTGLVFGALFAASALSLDALFGEAGADVRELAAIGILLNAAAQVVKVRNMILGAGVLPSGNDVRGVILGDAVSAFAVGLPLAIALGLWSPLGAIGIFLARIVEELVKLAIFQSRAARVRWNALAREHGGQAAASETLSVSPSAGAGSA